jgi:hypothetical protein
MTILIGIDRQYGGFYVYRGFTWRVCLGWLAVTFVPMKEGDLLEGIRE